MSNRTKEILLSVIVPVYNAEDYLPRMIEGFISQKVKRLELIFVDDKSSDGSLSLLREYEKKYKWITVYELSKNKGVGFARNFGVSKSNGAYLNFHDADDWIENGTFNSFEKHLQDFDYPDLIFFPYSVYNSNLEKVKSIKKKLDQIPNQIKGQDVYNAICNGQLNPATWNKIFKKSTWEKEHLNFDSEYFEDLSFIPYACLKMNTASYWQEAEYCYFLNEKGMTKVISEPVITASYSGLVALGNKLKTEENYSELRNDYIRFAFSTFCHNFFYSDRNSLFSDRQVIEFANLFDKFCKEQSITFLHLLNNDDALRLIRGMLNERTVRNLNDADHIKLGINEIDGLLNHYEILISQFQLLQSKSGDLNEIQNNWSSKTKKLKGKLKTRDKRIQILEKRIAKLVKFNRALRLVSSAFRWRSN